MSGQPAGVREWLHTPLLGGGPSYPTPGEKLDPRAGSPDDPGTAPVAPSNATLDHLTDSELDP